MSVIGVDTTVVCLLTLDLISLCGLIYANLELLYLLPSHTISNQLRQPVSFFIKIIDKCL